MLKVVKGMHPMDTFDFILNTMLEGFKQDSNMSSVKRIIRHGQGSMDTNHLLKRMRKF